MTTIAETLAGLAVAASYRHQLRAAPSDVTGPERVGGERVPSRFRAPSAPSTPVDADSYIPTASTGPARHG